LGLIRKSGHYRLTGRNWSVEIKAGFVEKLSMAGLLGRRGFSEASIVRFDQSSSFPYFDLVTFRPLDELQRVARTRGEALFSSSPARIEGREEV
jgi:hypothetical protein